MQQMQISFIRVVHGMHTTEKRSVRDVRMPRYSEEHTDICDEIEKQVRIQYHLLPDEEGQAKEPVPATGDAPDASEE